MIARMAVIKGSFTCPKCEIQIKFTPERLKKGIWPCCKTRLSATQQQNIRRKFKKVRIKRQAEKQLAKAIRRLLGLPVV
jgi:ribosomal protein L37AE/L43A